MSNSKDYDMMRIKAQLDSAILTGYIKGEEYNMRRRILDEKTQCANCGIFYDIDNIEHYWDSDAICKECDDISTYTINVLDEAIKRIEACGASPELTQAVDILSTFRHAYTTKSPEYLLMVIKKINGDMS